MEGIGNLLVCDSGHVISRDYSSELTNIAYEISSAISGVTSTVSGHAQAIRKEMKEAISTLSKKD